MGRATNSTAADFVRVIVGEMKIRFYSQKSVKTYLFPGERPVGISRHDPPNRAMERAVKIANIGNRRDVPQPAPFVRDTSF